MSKLRFGIIGCGGIARTHAQAILHIEDATLAAVSSRSAQKAKGFAEEFHCDYYPDYRDMLKRPDIDVVNICTPSGMHAEMAVEAAKNLKHAIVEKPMDVTLEKADRMIEAFKEKDVRLSVIFQRRFSDGIIKIKKMIDSGELGSINFGGCYVKWYRSQEYYDSASWRGTWELDGGGVLMNQSIHYIDLLQYLIGPVAEVTARCGTYTHERIEVEDAACAIVGFENGAHGVIEATTNAYPGLMSGIDIYGSQGIAVIENDAIKEIHLKNGKSMICSSKDAGSAANSPQVSFEGHKKQIEQVVESIKSGKKLAVDGAEGRKALEIILAIYKSAFYKESVKLPLDNSLFLKEISGRALRRGCFPVI